MPADMKDWPITLRRNAAVCELAAAMFKAKGEVYGGSCDLYEQPPHIRQRYITLADEVLKTVNTRVSGVPMNYEPLSAAWLADQIENTLNYPIGCDSITRVGRRWPVEIVTLKHHLFPFIVCFDTQVIAEARTCAADGARVMLTLEVSKNGRSHRLTGIRRV